jgi:hypothetical protein
MFNNSMVNSSIDAGGMLANAVNAVNAVNTIDHAGMLGSTLNMDAEGMAQAMACSMVGVCLWVPLCLLSLSIVSASASVGVGGQEGGACGCLSLGVSLVSACCLCLCLGRRPLQRES